jgi:hypothetical protein
MSLSRWRREWQCEPSYRRPARQDLTRVGRECESTFKDLKTGNDFDASMTASLGMWRWP